MDPIKVDFSGKGRAKEVVIPPEKKTLKLVICIIATIIGAAVAFYFMLPAINFKAIEFYAYIGVVILIYIISTIITTKVFAKPEYVPYVKKTVKIPVFIGLGFLAILVIGYLVSAPVFRAKAYSQIIEVTPIDFGTGDSITTIDSIEDFQSVPMIDKDAALVLANKTLGKLPVASQFVIDEEYSTQINYDGNPYRIFPLKYGDFFKWLKNTGEGFPAYVKVNMYTQEAEVVILKDQGLDNIEVATGEYLNERLDRVLRFNYPTYMFGTPSLEIDDNGHPWWVCERLDNTIGLLGGKTVIGVVLVDACDKDNHKYLTTDEVEKNSKYQWIDQLYSEELLVQQYNYYGKYQDGFINAYIGQENVMITTEGSSCITSGGDVWLYTGVTSVVNDDSIIGFAIINQRTHKAVFQKIAGTTEIGAQNALQGNVQDKGWTATFPVLLDIDGEATYFMALKDASNVVKSYGMVSVERVNDAVPTEGDANPDLQSCLSAYIEKVKASTKRELQVDFGSGGGGNGPATPDENTPEIITKEITGIITDIRTAVVNGNSIYYIELDDSELYYLISASDAPGVVILNTGDNVKITYDEVENTDRINAKDIAKVVATEE